MKMLVAEFPTESGVEIRTMGESLRPLRLYFNKSNVITKMLVVDDENKLFQLVPEVCKLNFCQVEVPGCVGGRLVRQTDDVILQLPGCDNFKKGYLRETNRVAPRPVSERFFLLSAETVTDEEFEALQAKAKASYEKFKNSSELSWN